MAKIVIEEKRINRIVKKAVAETMSEILSDPDFGLELTPYAKRRLRRVRNARKLIPFSEIKKKYG